MRFWFVAVALEGLGGLGITADVGVIAALAILGVMVTLIASSVVGFTARSRLGGTFKQPRIAEIVASTAVLALAFLVGAVAVLVSTRTR
jgi:hypothetical protein